MFKNTLKIIFTLILFLSSGSSIFASEHQSIIVGTSGQTKPMDYFDKDKNLTGIEIDILNEIERRSDLHFKYEITEFPSLFAGLDSKKFDLVVNNLGEGDDRRDKYLFSKYPYIVTHNKIITRQGERQKLSIADLSGKSVAAVASSPQAQFLESWNQKNPTKKINIVYVDSDVSQIIRDVYDGKFYATIYADTYVHDVEKTFGIKLQQHNINNESKIKEPGSYFIYRKDQEKNRNKIDKILSDMRADGTLRRISIKYLDKDETKLTPSLIEKNDTYEDRRIKKENSSKTNTETSQLFKLKLIPNFFVKILPKVPITLGLTVVSALIGLNLGLVLAIIKIKNKAVLSQLINIFVSFMRGTPQIVQLFLSFYGLPVILQFISNKFDLNWNTNNISPIIFAFIAFGLNEAAYMSEIFRSALLSVDNNEIEAAHSIGMTNGQTMLHIILPSALIVALPNITNSLISLLKATSLAFTITIVDIMGETRILAGSNLRFFEAYIAVAIIYWVLSIIFEWSLRKLENYLNVGK